jgi:hypothetical protein
MWNNEREQISTGYGTPSNGSFGYPNHGAVVNEQGVFPVSNWQSCRESFLTIQPQYNSFYFAHNLPRGRGRSIAVFFNKLEKKMGIKKGRRSTFQATSRREVVRVTPSRFWYQSSMRLSLLTALLRSAQAYRIHQDNFDTALWSNVYVSGTRPAVERFLGGSNHFWGADSPYTGWYTTFQQNNASRLERLLRPTKRRHSDPIAV